MTERQKREQSGERAMLSMHRGESTGRLYFSFTPTLFQGVTAFLIMVATIAGGMRWYEDNVLYQHLMEKGRAEMAAVANSHATKAELLSLSQKVEDLRALGIERDARYLTELSYLRMRIDQIADRMGVR